MSREDVHLARNGDELVVTVGSYRRLLTLPAGLSRQQVAGARVEGASFRCGSRRGRRERGRGRQPRRGGCQADDGPGRLGEGACHRPR
ncbi:MAG: hypothetical protein R2731_16810 [Nocardioides sp.]